ncbi:MAG: glycosyltransferase family 9 protein [Candidatus Omnitrophica bacterium]|nr:glycosyltransferase family 9 protein [Candidatus Omnitrophota bacterium]
MEKYKLDCKYFSGYKPCSPGKVCSDCKDYSSMGTRILIINFDALGDVLRTTAMLHPLKRKYKTSHVTWLTQETALPLLKDNHYIDRVLEYSVENTLLLLTERFDVLMNVDKSRRSGSLANLVDAKEKYGFGITETGAIYPYNVEAEHLYELGLNDQMKFKENKRSEQELLCEAMGLEYQRDEYILNLTQEEKDFVKSFKNQSGIKENQIVIGFNTGCSGLYPYKKLNFDKQLLFLKKLHKIFGHDRILLLGGREDTENNSALKKKLQNKVVSTPTNEGLRKGILFMELCDIVVTGDTLGLHMALALKKSVAAFFTITCAAEIDLYERGDKVLTEADCSPCWKRECQNEKKCNEAVNIDSICEAVKDLRSKIEKKA